MLAVNRSTEENYLRYLENLVEAYLSNKQIFKQEKTYSNVG